MIKHQTIVTSEDLERETGKEEPISTPEFEVKEYPTVDDAAPTVEGGFPVNTYPKASEDTLKEIGEAEAVKEAAEQNVLNTYKFDTIIQKNTSRTLYKLKSKKILDFFPDEVTIETTKVNISLRDYFFLRRIHTVAVEDIEDVYVETTPIYATLKIVDKGFVENYIEVQFLKKDEAKKARRIIQGLITAYKEKVDIGTLPDEELVEKLEILGKAGEVENVH